MKILLLLFSALSFCFPAYANFFAVSKDSNTVVVHETSSDTLFVYNIPFNKKNSIVLDPGAADWLQIIADTLVAVHYIYSNDKTVVYNLATGNKVFASPEHCFANADETALYFIDNDWCLHMVRLPGFVSVETMLTLPGGKGSRPSGFLKFSADGSRIAIAYDLQERGYLGVFTLASTKQESRIAGFACCQVFSGGFNNELHFFDWNKNGTLLLAGNESRATLYNAGKGNVVASLTPLVESGSDFGSAAFSTDGKMFFVQGRQTIYIGQANGFRILDTLSVPGQWTSYGSPAKPYLDSDFTWEQLILSKDNRYLFLLCRPLASTAAGTKPFLERREAGATGFQDRVRISYR